MDSIPLVSVYIATHNRVNLLKRALNSVLAQTYKNIEIIVADDGSKDETSQVIQEYIKDHKIVYVKNEKPKGACSARNLAINIAQGEYITGLDDDDEFLPDRVAHLVKLFEQGQYSCVASPYAEFTSNGLIERTLDDGDISLQKLLHSNVIGNQILTKTTYLRDINGFDPQMPAFQDYDTWVRLVAAYGPAYKSSTITYIWYTDHEENRISKSMSKRQIALKRFIGKHDTYMTMRHKDSMLILSKKIKNEAYSLSEFIELTNKDNFKMSLSYFVNTNMSWLKHAFDKIRFK
ncbi:glycosyltransferase [Thalassotalea profundi]|uniref:Glycosyltransferase 2-like domain-containing protein n=1 Tax=Thalassotalea profundi TaxID=2036687 RepID=A0ABQ3IHB4_9GAMM|nr:glycosyltransferase [Thalassotalea profundi]GHE80564.1 hypothetical protein GCM10011501_05620 [Thalassotalea profundi]